MERGRTRKTRLLEEYSYPSLWKGVVSGSTIINTTYPQRVRASQITDSYSNPTWFKTRDIIRYMQSRIDSGKASPEYIERLNHLRGLDYGSSFWTTRQSSSLISPDINVRDQRITSLKFLTFVGKYFAIAAGSDIGPTDSIWPTMPDELTEINYCRTKGTFAINATVPTKPMFSLATALGELHSDGLPSLFGSVLFRSRGFAARGKALGSEYLNLEFGWKPFVSDLKDLCKVIVQAREKLAIYEANSGRYLGRHFEFPTEVTNTLSTLSNAAPSPALDTSFYVGTPIKARTLHRLSTVECWFTGGYQYYLPPVTDSREKIIRYSSLAEKLLGLRITPEVLWNLAPWTWLSDWFLNFGNVLSNVSAMSADNCVLRHGYIMCSKNTVDTYVHPGVNQLGHGNTGPIIQTFSTKSKMRRRATPYGFGVTWSGFTPRQIAILAALGVTRDWRLAAHS
jgi:hypothetical protein